MGIVLGVVALLAIVSAVGSASVAQRKRATKTQTAPKAESTRLQSTRLEPSQIERPESLSSESLKADSPEVEQTAPAAPSAHPALVAVATPEPTAFSADASAAGVLLDSAVPQTPRSEAVSLSGETSTAELVELIAATQPDLPFATSLTVSQVVHPNNADAAIVIESAEHDFAAAAPSHHASRNLLEEIAELDQSGHQAQLNHLRQYVEHSDSALRAAATFALGELASRSHGHDREAAIGLLVQLTQDADMLVRSQAAAAMAAIPNPNILP